MNQLTSPSRPSVIIRLANASGGWLRFAVVLLFAAGLTVSAIAGLQALAQHSDVSAVTLSSAPTSAPKKVFLLIFDPRLPSKGNVTLTAHKGWNTSTHSPSSLTPKIQTAINTASKGYVKYSITKSQTVYSWPTKVDGFNYNESTYLQCLSNSSTCHSPDAVDYKKIFDVYKVCAAGVDEVWMWGGPYFGFEEYKQTIFCNKSIFVMGFNYEREIGEALHDFGHRMEFVLINRLNRSIPWAQNTATVWNKFSMINGHCGNVHFPPGTNSDYHYANSAGVPTDCDGYNNYPTGPFTKLTKTCSSWSCSQEGYLKWWLGHIPAKAGATTDMGTGWAHYNNWWIYYSWYDQTKTGKYVALPSPLPTPTFSNLSAIAGATSVSFNGTFTGPAIDYNVEMSTSSTMASDVYVNFGASTYLPVVVTNPQQVWDKYRCGRTLYWRFYSQDRLYVSSIKSLVINCPVSSPTPTPTPTVAPTPTPTQAGGLLDSVTAQLGASTASFTSSPVLPVGSYAVDLATTPMVTDIYVNFAGGSTTPITVSNPQAQWDKYRCGAVLYYRVSTADRTVVGPTKQATVTC